MKPRLKLILLLLAAIVWPHFECRAETKRILAVGNSFSYDAIMQELVPVVRSGGDDIVVGFPYKGGTTLELHWQYITNDTQIYNYHKIVDGKITTTGTGSRCFDEDIISSEPWDIVVIQTDHNYSGAYDHYFPYLDNLMAYLREHLTNKDAKFYLYMTWAYQDGSPKMLELINKGLYEDQTDHYAKLTDCALRAAIQSGIGAENIIPVGTAVQNGRTSYIGDAYNRDGYHLDLVHGRYTASLTWYAKIFGKNPFDVSYRPDGMSEFCSQMCKTAVAKALETPMSVSSLQEDFGVNPDAVFNPLDRPVYINFGIAAGNASDSKNVWNNITTPIAGAAIRNIFNIKGYGTELCLTVEKAFGGVATDGMAYTGADFDIPAGAAQSSFYGTGNSSVMLSGLYPGQAYDMKVFASAADGTTSKFKFMGENEAEASLDPVANSGRLAEVTDIKADERGRIRLDVSAEGVFHINALAIVPHMQIPGMKPVRINFTTTDAAIPETGWNNITSYTVGTQNGSLTFADGTPSGISLKLTKSFAGTTSDGATQTETPLDMPATVSSTGFWVNGVEKDGILADCAEIVFDGLDASLNYEINFFASLTDATETHEAEYSVFGKTDNFIALNANDNSTRLATLPSVTPDANGSLRVTVTPGATSEDQYKIGYLNAMAIMVPAMVDITPFEPVAKDPWDGKSVVKPTADASGNYIIYCGAELAWVAERVNNGMPVNGVRLASDIDLGGNPWTPIGYGQWFNGNFDGRGYHIRNIFINKDDLTGDTHFGGLIGGVNNIKSTICDLHLSGRIEIPATMTDKAKVGSLIGKANNIGSISNCHSDVEIVVDGSAAYIGGLLGFMKNATVTKSSYSGTITINGAVTNGVGGLLGCTNSSVAGVEATFIGCYFTGTISNNGTKTPKYLGGINAYSNVSAGAETITNNYIACSIKSKGTNKGVVYGLRKTPAFFCDNNFYLDNFGFKATGSKKASADDFHSGKVAYLLNGDQTDFFFGQNLAEPESMPETYNEANRVYRIMYMVDNAPYDTVYCNSRLKLPSAPALSGKEFDGWKDDKGNDYAEGTVIATDLELHADFSSGLNSLQPDGTCGFEVIGNILKVTSDGRSGMLSILSIDGKTVKSCRIDSHCSEIYISELPKGIYIVSFGNTVGKFARR